MTGTDTGGTGQPLPGKSPEGEPGQPDTPAGRERRERPSSIIASQPIEQDERDALALLHAGSAGQRQGNRPVIPRFVSTYTDEARKLLARTFARCDGHLTFLTHDLYAYRHKEAWSGCCREIGEIFDRCAGEIARAEAREKARLDEAAPGWRSPVYLKPTRNEVIVSCAFSMRLASIFEDLDRLFRLRHTQEIMGVAATDEAAEGIRQWEEVIYELIRTLGRMRRETRERINGRKEEPAPVPGENGGAAPQAAEEAVAASPSPEAGAGGAA